MTVVLPSWETRQLLGDAGGCYQKRHCSGLCLWFQQSSLVSLLGDIPDLRRRMTWEINPTRRSRRVHCE